MSDRFEDMMDALNAAYRTRRQERPAASAEQENLRRARVQALAEALANDARFGRFMPGSEHYASHFFSDLHGAAYRQPDMFRSPLTPCPVANPERDKALALCRDLKRLRDSSTFDGEKRNAQTAMDKLQARHGIKDGEI